MVSGVSDMDTKYCPRCMTTRPISEFYRHSAPDRRDGWRWSSYCKPCGVEYNRSRYDSAREAERWGYRGSHTAHQTRNNYLLRTFGITVEDFDERLAAQSGGCANPGCRKPFVKGEKTFHVDYDHSCCPGLKSCGSCVRGILCPACNVALGYIHDDLQVLSGLIDYLRAGK